MNDREWTDRLTILKMLSRASVSHEIATYGPNIWTRIDHAGTFVVFAFDDDSGALTDVYASTGDRG